MLFALFCGHSELLVVGVVAHLALTGSLDFKLCLEELPVQAHGARRVLERINWIPVHVHHASQTGNHSRESELRLPDSLRQRGFEHAVAAVLQSTAVSQ